LLSDRVYRPALPVDDVAAHLEAGRGTQFDPEIVELLLVQLDEALALRATALSEPRTSFVRQRSAPRHRPRTNRPGAVPPVSWR
jgi:HD-GYP domain-containing protein (c-di-GMP phosphodiesterase class II)